MKEGTLHIEGEAYEEDGPFCEWHYDEDDYCVKWDTSCDNAFQFTNDGPLENGFEYCPYCGEPLMAVIPEPEPDDDFA